MLIERGNSMGAPAVWKLIVWFAGRRRRPAREPIPNRRSIAGKRCGWPTSYLVALAILMLTPNVSGCGVLSESEIKKVEEIKPLFQNLVVDLVQTSKRSDISSGEAECIMSTIRELLQISDELSSYEYLITIEKEMTDFGDKSPIPGVLKFAIEKSSGVLAGERKRLAQMSDRCSRFPLALAKVQQAIQFVDATINFLSLIQMRL
jgi:hypothetical protein